MHYIEIGQDIVDAIKGGADYSGQSESEEIVATINDFSFNFAEIVKVIKEFIDEMIVVFKKYMK